MLKYFMVVFGGGGGGFMYLFICLSSFEYEIGLLQFSDRRPVITKLIRDPGATQLSSITSYQ